MPRDIEFENLLQERRHEEIIAALTGLANAVDKKSTGDPELLKIINKNSEIILNFVEEVRKSKPPESLKEEFKSITTLLFDIKAALAKDKTPKEWSFTINRDSGGYIESVNAKAK